MLRVIGHTARLFPLSAEFTQRLRICFAQHLNPLVTSWGLYFWDYLGNYLAVEFNSNSRVAAYAACARTFA